MAYVTAFTEVDYPEEAYYPGGVSVSEDDGVVEISVRETGSEDFVYVHMPIQEYRRMLVESLEYINDPKVLKWK